MDESKLLKRLARPEGVTDVVLDTDTYNEVDDQYALSYLIHSGHNVKAIFAAPFLNDKSVSPEDGMEKSYDEIKKLLKLAGKEDIPAYRGSRGYLPDEKTPVASEVAETLVRLACSDAYAGDRPLYVISIGAITNVASALLMKPEIAERIVVLWLGGNAFHWPTAKEFNLYQDIAAVRVVFDSGAPVVLFPAMGVVTHLTVTEPELRHWLAGKNELADYLYGITVADTEPHNRGRAWSRVIWDVSAVAWLVKEGAAQSYIAHSPVVSYDGMYGFDNTRHFMRYVYMVNRDVVFTDMFEKITKGS